MKDRIVLALNEGRSMLEAIVQDDQKIDAIEYASNILIDCLNSGNTIFSCGNGGSMSDAMHFAEELSGRYRKNRAALPAVAISDPGYISCVANDLGYEYIFSRYLEAHAREGDCLLAISTSGTSENVYNAARYAKSSGIRVIGLTGRPASRVGCMANVDLCVGNSEFADRIQELHIKLIHILIEMIERSLFPENYA